jgi:hypothetical protein
MTIWQVWAEFFVVWSIRDPKQYRVHGYKAGIWAVCLLHLHIAAFGASRPSPTLISDAFHLPSFSFRCQWWLQAPFARGNKLVEEWHHLSKCILRDHTVFRFGSVWEQVETLRQHAVYAQAEKMDYSDSVVSGIRRRIGEMDSAVRSTHVRGDVTPTTTDYWVSGDTANVPVVDADDEQDGEGGDGGGSDLGSEDGLSDPEDDAEGGVHVDATLVNDEDDD